MQVGKGKKGAACRQRGWPGCKLLPDTSTLVRQLGQSDGAARKGDTWGTRRGHAEGGSECQVTERKGERENSRGHRNMRYVCFLLNMSPYF